MGRDFGLRGAPVGARRAAAWDDEPGAARYEDAAVLLARLREEGHERLLFPVGPRSAPFAPLAHHLFFPGQVLESPRSKRSRSELVSEATERGASVVLLLDPAGDWVAVPAEDAP